jgi:sugar lactone lactonase YvrE
MSKKSLRRVSLRRASLALFIYLLLAFFTAVSMIGCSHWQARRAPEQPPVFFPLPPMPARVQYLGSVSSPLDLPHKRGGFAEFVLGPEPVRYRLAKPINAVLVGNRVYICDTIMNTVLVYDLVTGDAHQLAGDRGIGKIKQPNNIAVDNEGNFYVADKLRNAVLVYGPDEQFLHAWGRPGEIEPVAVAASSQVLYVCDIKNHRIEVWNRRDGTPLRTIGTKGSGPGQFFLPTYIALDDNENLYVTDTGNFRVQKFSPDGTPLMQFGELGVALGQFAWPKGVDVDSHGRIYVVDSRFNNVQIFDADGRLLLFFGGPGPDLGNIDLPAGIRVYPWPSIQWLSKRVASGFDPEFLAMVISQKGAGYINFFAVARETAKSP